jgi:hypothetical protein
VADWRFLTNHARALLSIAHDPDLRLRDLANALDVTERTAYSIVTDLTEGGYVAKQKDGRRNVYHIQSHMPVRDSVGRQREIGELLGLFLEDASPGEAIGQLQRSAPEGGVTPAT